jgi:hypothetical protein
MNINSFSGSSTKVEGINKLWLNILQEPRHCAPHPLGSKGLHNKNMAGLFLLHSSIMYVIGQLCYLGRTAGGLQLGLIHLLHGGLKRTEIITRGMFMQTR